MSHAMALFLSVFILSVSVIQAVHKHSTCQPDGKNPYGKEYVYGAEKCSICDYSTHQQVIAHIHSQPQVIIPVKKPITLLSPHVAGTYKFTLQGYTNKGPPVTC